ncbi:MAG: YbaB/EbfC family nucleoid-associated protein [Saprospiraceae bacterium]|nr:YbaB/EbfC family nucleoid-associated protein [Saprospiraceae bacterium]
MFDGLLDNMKEQEAAMQQKLATTRVSANVQGITMEGNAAMTLDHLHIDQELLHPDKKEELEDLLITCFTEWKNKVDKLASEYSQAMVNDILPPGFDDLIKNFK